jgi:site-specific recombinase XerD
VCEAAEALIDALEADGTKASTIRGYRSVAGRFERFGSKKVDKIASADVESFDADLHKRGLSPATRWQALRLLDATLKYAVKRGWAINAPKIEKPKGKRGKTPVRYLRLQSETTPPRPAEGAPAPA